jgi:hypothetical protein
MKETKRGLSRSKASRRRAPLLIAIIFAAFVIFVVITMVVNSRKPAVLKLEKPAKDVKGTYFVKTNQALLQQMIQNWLPNDLFWPTVLLDNMPHFQIGQLEVVRYNVRVLRDNLSRMRTTDKLDPFAEDAFTALSNNPYKWWFPSAESKWKEGSRNLEQYYENMLEGRSHFYPRADNLVDLLGQYVSLMGGANTRLINAPRDILRTLSIEEERGGAGGGSRKLVNIDIPWYEIDNNFYYAQGVAYALNESFLAIRNDFADVLVDKNSMALVDKILEALGRCYFEPLIVFNGDLNSIFANHSFNLSGVFNDARQKIGSLTTALKQG